MKDKRQEQQEPGGDTPPESGMDLARRRLLLKMVYVPPAVVGALALTLEGCQVASCAPATCNPNTCNPSTCPPKGGPCNPNNCNPNSCNPNPCNPSLCGPVICNPGKTP